MTQTFSEAGFMERLYLWTEDDISKEYRDKNDFLCSRRLCEYCSCLLDGLSWNYVVIIRFLLAHPFRIIKSPSNIREMKYVNRVVPFHLMYSITVICFAFLINAFEQGRNIYSIVFLKVCIVSFPKCSTISQD